MNIASTVGLTAVVAAKVPVLEVQPKTLSRCGVAQLTMRVTARLQQRILYFSRAKDLFPVTLRIAFELKSRLSEVARVALS
jgi:hypothetical protein